MINKILISLNFMERLILNVKRIIFLTNKKVYYLLNPYLDFVSIINMALNINLSNIVINIKFL
jgi:hypothetical protein